MQEFDLRRSVLVEGVEYLVDVKPSGARHLDRFGTRGYAVVELPGHWQATVPVPDCVRNTAQLWYRELIELVQHALVIVSHRSAAA